MTREEFNTDINNSYLSFKQRELALEPIQIYEDGYAIAKRMSIKDYLTQSDDEVIKELYPFSECILGDLCDYEMKFDTAMWTTWDDIEIMIKYFLDGGTYYV